MNIKFPLAAGETALHQILPAMGPEEIRSLVAFNNIPSPDFLDQLDAQVMELIKLENPQTLWDAESLQSELSDFFTKQERDTYGNWVYYPWRNAFVRVLPEEDFIKVRTVRNKFKITAEEQEKLASKKIGIIGLSVGQSVALALAMERLFGELRIADFDHLELGNMNRIRTGLTNLGLPKTLIVQREIAEIDPFLKVVVFEEGIHEGNLADFLEGEGKLDLLIEECDGLEMKIRSRIAAKKRQIPVLMDTSDRGMMDIERFDLQPKRPIFHGRLAQFGDEENLVDNFAQKRMAILTAILDMEQLSPRAKTSIAEMGKTITNWPQLASSVIMGGGMCAHVARNLLLGNSVPSGRFYIDLDELIRE